MLHAHYNMHSTIQCSALLAHMLKLCMHVIRGEVGIICDLQIPNEYLYVIYLASVIFPSLHEAIYFLHVICKPVTCNLHVYYMPAISSLHALCMLHVQLFQYACNLHFACAVTHMLLILAVHTLIATMLHVCPGIYALATQIPYLAELIITLC